MILNNKTIKVAPGGRIKLRTCKSIGAKLTPPCSPSVLGGWVYFIRSGETVKIGFSANVARRFICLQASNPVEIEFLAAFPGSRDDEFSTQVIFRHHHIRGEWFRDGPAIREYIAMRRAGRKTTKIRASFPKHPEGEQREHLAKNIAAQMKELTDLPAAHPAPDEGSGRAAGR